MNMKLTIAALLISLATTAHSWSSIDTATLQFWSPPSLCTQENFYMGVKTLCSEKESVDNINVKLDNTGAICYSNPMEYSSDGSSWFTWLGPKSNQTNAEVWAYSLFVPKGEPVPQCDERGVCDPCDALDPIRGSDPADWANHNYDKETGYSWNGASSNSFSHGGCAVMVFLPANDVHPTNFCAPFQGNITVEFGDPHTCVNQDITTAEKCGEACDEDEKQKGELKKVVFANTESGEAACCACTYYGLWETTEACKSKREGEEDWRLCSADDSPSGSNQIGAIGAMLFVVAATVSFIF